MCFIKQRKHAKNKLTLFFLCRHAQIRESRVSSTHAHAHAHTRAHTRTRTIKHKHSCDCSLSQHHILSSVDLCVLFLHVWEIFPHTQSQFEFSATFVLSQTKRIMWSFTRAFRGHLLLILKNRFKTLVYKTVLQCYIHI